MGCCASDLGVPDVILGNPDNSVANFFRAKRAGPFSSHFNVFNQEDQKWLMIRDDSSFFDAIAKFQLENFVRGEDERGEPLATAKIKRAETEIKKSADFENDDSDDESWSDDEDEGDDGSLEAKLKWKISRSGCIESDGVRCEIQVRMKGKTKVEYTVTDGEASHFPDKVKTDVKKVFYKVKVNGDPLPLLYSNKGWAFERKRDWEAPLHFRLERENDSQCEITTHANSPLPVASSLLLSWAIANFFSPTTYVKNLEDEAKKFAKEVIDARKD